MQIQKKSYFSNFHKVDPYLRQYIYSTECQKQLNFLCFMYENIFDIKYNYN